jgi:hypothetical protein
VNSDQNFLNAVVFFRQTFGIVFALALTEALKQFVAEHPKQPNDPLSQKLVHWDRLPALLAFVFLIVPFFQGTVRYFYLTYESQMPSANYDRYLAFDGIAFLIEAAFFFAMSRAITLARWRSLYMCIIFLLIVDSCWGGVEYQHGALPTLNWIYLNIPLAVVLGLLLWFIRTDERRRLLVALYFGTAVVFIRTVLDYWLDPTFYFPAT